MILCHGMESKKNSEKLVLMSDALAGRGILTLRFDFATPASRAASSKTLLAAAKSTICKPLMADPKSPAGKDGNIRLEPGRDRGFIVRRREATVAAS